MDLMILRHSHRMEALKGMSRHVFFFFWGGVDSKPSDCGTLFLILGRCSQAFSEAFQLKALTFKTVIGTTYLLIP